MVSAIPEGYHAVTPYLIVNDAANAIEFYKKAFGAIEIMRFPKPDGKIGHAEMQIGDSKIMLADEFPEMNKLSPKTYGGSAIGIHLYVENVDAIFKQATKAGAKVQRPLEDMFYGDRGAGLEDPYGHSWYISTHIEDVSPEEIEKRLANLKEKA